MPKVIEYKELRSFLRAGGLHPLPNIVIIISLLSLIKYITIYLRARYYFTINQVVV